MKSYAVAKPLPRLKGEVPAAAGGEVTLAARPQTSFRAPLEYMVGREQVLPSLY